MTDSLIKSLWGGENQCFDYILWQIYDCIFLCRVFLHESELVLAAFFHINKTLRAVLSACLLT